MDAIKIYARADENSLVTEILNTIFDLNRIVNTDIFLDEGYGDDFAHPQLKYQLHDENNLHNWKIKNNEMVETTAEDKLQEKNCTPLPPKSQLDILQETVEMLVLNSLEV